MSADRLGGIRLWPTLDGSREPVVIQSTAPHALAIAHDGDGFAIGTLDAAGGVVIVRTTSAGAVRDRITVASEQPASEIDSTPAGLLVLRADQRLELVDAAGAIQARLVPGPGTHIDSLLVRNEHVLALVQEDKQLRGRFIAFGHGMHWAGETPSFASQIAHAALSPDGALLAISRPHNLHPQLIDLATGAPRKVALCVDKNWPEGEGDDEDDRRRRFARENAPTPLAFFDDDTVACMVSGALVWWRTEGTKVESRSGFSFSSPAVAISDRALVAGVNESLAIATPVYGQFLGYGMHDVDLMYSGPGGVLLGGVPQQLVALDGQLRERARFNIGFSRPDWLDAALLDDRYAVTLTQRYSSLRTGLSQLAVYDGLSGAVSQQLAFDGRDSALSYEPTTRLLATSDGAAAMLLRFDPASHRFDDPIRLPNAVGASKLFVVDPQLAGGIAALQLDEIDDGLLVGEFHQADLAAAPIAQPRARYRVTGKLLAVDRAGRLYLRDKTEQAADPPSDGEHDDAVVYSHGTAGARLTGMATRTLRPSPDGTLIAAFKSPTLSLITRDGKVRWEAALWDGQDVTWTPTGALVVRFPTGIATLDLETGALAQRRCGWGFGLSEQQNPLRRPGATVCDAQ